MHIGASPCTHLRDTSANSFTNSGSFSPHFQWDTRLPSLPGADFESDLRRMFATTSSKSSGSSWVCIKSAASADCSLGNSFLTCSRSSRVAVRGAPPRTAAHNFLQDPSSTNSATLSGDNLLPDLRLGACNSLSGASSKLHCPDQNKCRRPARSLSFAA